MASRLKHFATGVASGYAGLLANAIYTIATVPLALHYLSRAEFGLWTLAMQVSSYLLLIDLGMAGSISRILIDHKDRPQTGAYGAVIKTGGVVLIIQGTIVAVAGIWASRWLPKLLGLPLEFHHDFARLFAAYCVVIGVLFPGRMSQAILLAHQRYDVVNYLQIAYFTISIVVMWFGFAWGFGIYAMLLSNAVAMTVTAVATLLGVLRLRFFPVSGSWNNVNWSIFKELFAFGNDLFLLSVGLQLFSASQVVIISRTLGLDAAATWSIATKPFTLAQQFVGRIWDFSSGAASEMVVRGERERLEYRFRDLVVVTASLSIFVGVGIAVCNHSFLEIWTKGRITWSVWNDCLIGLLLAVTSVTRVHIGLMGQTKKIGTMRYIYFLEGVTFFVAAFLIVRYAGMPGIIATAILMDLIWSGIYGTRRTAIEFSTTIREVAWEWLLPPLKFATMLVPLAALCWWATRGFSAITKLTTDFLFLVFVGPILAWRIGITAELRREFIEVVKRKVPMVQTFYAERF